MQDKCCVYFISDMNGYIKIGHASYIKSRLDSLQTSNAQKLVCIAYIELDNRDDAIKVEKELHSRFLYCRAPGGCEWFKEKPVLEYIVDKASKKWSKLDTLCLKFNYGIESTYDRQIIMKEREIKELQCKKKETKNKFHDSLLQYLDMLEDFNK